MIKKAFLLIFAFTTSIAYSQCIDADKIVYGGNFDSHHYTYFCPRYQFSFDGDTSKIWNILDPIDIRKVAKSIFPIKEKVENQIKGYSGESFFSRMKFSSVEIVFPDSIAKFEDRVPGVNMKKCKSKYYFYYTFNPDSLATYNIGLAVDEEGNIVSPFNFPSKGDYQTIDPSLTVCKVIEIAKRINNKILPIEEVKFDYDKKERRFYWLVSQEIKNVKEGINLFNQVVIDAAEPKKQNLRKERLVLYSKK
ncbi:hypothetical protein [Adhaeribacter aquaticus]|uniref:hypothetical protein n=1 Tax=Adhaeribacter aquaticus TaxID=299567 RepID=UPI0004224EB2|nr:hypothetical protein [Adhaeribacter aquaticus]